MKKLVLLSSILFLSFNGFSQLFDISSDPVFYDENGTELKLALSGGLNQPMFSNMDFNRDGKQDLYAFDRTGDKSLVFISKTVGGVVEYEYAPEYEHYIPSGKYLSRLVDYNDDGFPDLWTYKNDSIVLYQNFNGAFPDFKRKPNLKALDKVNVSSANPDKPFSLIVGSLPSIADIDNDEDIDFVSILNNGGSDMVLYKNISTEQNVSLEDLEFYIPDKCYGGINEFQGDLIINAPCYYGEDYAWKKKHEATKTILHFDNDFDGDFDLFYGSSEKFTNPIYYFENGKADLNYHKDTFISRDTAYFTQSVESQIPTAPAMSYVDINLDGTLDLLLSTNEKITESFAIKQTQNVLYFENKDGTWDPDFQLVKNDFLVGDMIDFGAHTVPSLVDIDNDGDQDLFIASNGDHYFSGDTADRIIFLENQGTSLDPQFHIKDRDWMGIKASSLQEMRPYFSDLDNDNDFDLILGLADGTLAYLENIGSATSPSYGAIQYNFQGIQVNGSPSPCLYDLNNDGLKDLLLGNYAGTVRYYENTGSASSPSFTLVEDTLGGMLSNASKLQSFLGPKGFYDSLVLQSFGYSSVDVAKLRDDSMAIVLGGFEGLVKVFRIPADITSTFSEAKDYMKRNNSMVDYSQDWGEETHPGTADLNGDGVSDLIIGNNRGGINYVQGGKSLSIAKLEAQAFTVYPNPSNGDITIVTEFSNERLKYQLLDIQGRTVQSGETHSGSPIAISSSQVNGVYFVQLESNSFFYAPQKFILLR